LPHQGSSRDDPGRARPYAIEQDEDGVWCAHAQLRPGLGAHGEGENKQAAIADLREALTGLIASM
jgi:predicted RNase H-like HicB family nuclease